MSVKLDISHPSSPDVETAWNHVSTTPYVFMTYITSVRIIVKFCV